MGLCCDKERDNLDYSSLESDEDSESEESFKINLVSKE